MTWHAYIDETESDRTLDPHCYILAAAVCNPTYLDNIRIVMRGLLLPGQRKLHWRDESDKRRQQIADAVATVGVEYVVVVVRQGRKGERPERRRRHCLERLLFELDQRGIEHVVLESRGTRDDQRDRELLAVLRPRRILRGGLRVDHAYGHTRPCSGCQTPSAARSPAHASANRPTSRRSNRGRES